LVGTVFVQQTTFGRNRFYNL